MVERTKYGEVVEDYDEGYLVNTKSFGQPLLLVFLDYNKSLIDKLNTLPEVYYIDKNEISQSIESFRDLNKHLMTYCPRGMLSDFFDTLILYNRKIIVIDCCHKDNGYHYDAMYHGYKLLFEDKSDNFVFEYLKTLLNWEV